MKCPSIIQADNLERQFKSNSVQTNVNGIWVPARPLNFKSIKNRLAATWLVFTGKADTLLWRGQ